MKKQMEKAEACSSEKCKYIMWLAPIAIIVLVWTWPEALWSQIVITILAAIGLIANCCNCNKK
jgi:hypothetical protein